MDITLDAISSDDPAPDRSWEEAPPDPAATVESLRHLGYEPRSAIADLIDNSITAGARTIQVTAHWAGAESWCSVGDDGAGMTPQKLSQAMRIGSADPVVPRKLGDLGRYGFGLKTASFSQAREVTVLSLRRADGAPAVRCWDLDEVRRTGRWILLRAAPPGALPVLAALDRGSVGTLVLWRRLTGLVQPDSVNDEVGARRHFNDSLRNVERWLGMVFGRFLADTAAPLQIRVNRVNVQPFDPFLEENAATQVLAEEVLRFRGSPVRVRPYVLPHETKLTPEEAAAAGGPLGWNRQQGFYVFRRDRLIAAGGWLGLGLPSDDVHNLARIAVDVPAELDEAWQLDVSKATVRPPDPLKNDLWRIAVETRRRAKAVFRHRGGTPIRDPVRRIEHVWNIRVRDGVRQPTINRSHPLVAKLLDDAGPRKREVSEVLALIEEALPAPLIPPKAAERPPLENRPPDEILALAESGYESLLRRGYTRAEAARRICTAEPFNQYIAILERFGGVGG